VERDLTILLLRIGLVAVLYFFLFQLFVVLWRDLRQPAAAPHAVPTHGLIVLEPAGSGQAAGETIALQAITSLGRSELNTIVLADQSVSAEHALASYRLGQWWIEDLGSTNGTFINDMGVEQPTVLRTGDVIRLGSVRLRAQLS